MVSEKKRLTIIAGHYGSGKTEFAVNLACALGDAARPCALCDLDVVNPYFRAREREEELAAHGVQLVAPRLQGPEADIPALPAEIFRVLQDRGLWGVVDLGGDGAGARAMARFRGSIDADETHVLFVLNANRPETGTLRRAAAYLDQIQAVLGMAFTGIVNNTHLCAETAPEDVVRGADLAQALSAETGIPVLCHAVRRDLAAAVEELVTGEIFPLDIYMRKPWEEEDHDGKGER